MFCLLASTTCHLLGCLSAKAFYALLRVDYAGISTLIATSFYPPVCKPLQHSKPYLIISTFCCKVCKSSGEIIISRCFCWIFTCEVHFACNY